MHLLGVRVRALEGKNRLQARWRGTSGTIADLHCGQRKVHGLVARQAQKVYLGFGVELREAARHGHVVIVCAHRPPLALRSIRLPISTCPYCTSAFQQPHNDFLGLAALPSTPFSNHRGCTLSPSLQRQLGAQAFSVQKHEWASRCLNKLQHEHSFKASRALSTIEESP